MGFTKPDAGVMATNPATAPEIPPSTLGFPVIIHSATASPALPAAAAEMGRDKGAGRQPGSAERAAGVEAEPAYPQQAGADEAEHQACAASCLRGKPMRLPR